MNNTIVVPCYNEEKRSSLFIPNLLSFVKKNLPNTEVIIVNDGSKDNTVSVIKKFISDAKAESFAKIIGYKKNQGKGNAVALGVKAARGEKILFIDADGSIPPHETKMMFDKLDEYEVVVGDRTSAKSKIKSTILRKITSFGFNFVVSLIYQYSLRDNLCGFKGFRKYVAKKIFSDLKDKRWVFDVELFYKIRKKRYSLYFLPIKWKHVGNSKIRMYLDPLLWFIRIIKLRFQLIGWK